MHVFLDDFASGLDGDFSYEACILLYDYFNELDRRLRLEFPSKFDKVDDSTTEKAKPAQTVASARRPANTGRRKTVKLTPSQVAIAKRLGVPLEEYAKQLNVKEGA